MDTHSSHGLGEPYLHRYGHLLLGSDADLYNRLDALYAAGQRDQGADGVKLLGALAAPARPQNAVSAADDAPTTL